MDKRGLRTVHIEDSLTEGIIGLYVPKSFFNMIQDAMSIMTTEELEQKASQKGLSLTLDGVHLNSTGAGMVAEVFLSKIKGHSSRSLAT